MSQYDDLFEEVIEEKPKRKQNEDLKTWTHMLQTLIIFLLLILFVRFARILIIGNLFSERLFLYNMLEYPAYRPEYWSVSLFSSLPLNFINLLISAISQTIIFSVTCLFIYLSARILRAQGSLKQLITQSANWNVALYITRMVTQFSISTVMINNFINEYSDSIGVGVGRFSCRNSACDAFSDIEATSHQLLILFGVIWSLMMVFIISRNYEISNIRSLGIIILTHILGLILWVIIILLSLAYMFTMY